MIIWFNLIDYQPRVKNMFQKCFQGDENDDAGGLDDDAAAFRRTQSRRKARGIAFLEDSISTFNLLVTLTLASILAPITNKAFQLSERDRRNINQSGQSTRTKASVKRRMWTKGPEVLLEDSESALYFRNIKLRALQACQRLWGDILSGTPTIFACAASFWPSTQLARSKWMLLCENILRNIAAVKWRLLTKFSFPPWSLCDLEDPECSAETVPRQK